MSSLVILSSPAPGVALLTLNRPEAANALNMAMGNELASAVECATNAQWRAVILTGSGMRAFCAGADLKERNGMDETQWRAQHACFERALHALMRCAIPIIGAVNGAAFGGGLELALACDFIYASTSATFAFSEVTLGIMPGLGGAQRLPRAVGERRAKEWILTGQAFSAQEGVACGLINRLCAPGDLLGAATGAAQRIAANAPLAVRQAKRAIREGLDMPLEEALSHGLALYETLIPTRDRKEGIQAFNEKRKPVFTGE